MAPTSRRRGVGVLALAAGAEVHTHVATYRSMRHWMQALAARHLPDDWLRCYDPPQRTAIGGGRSRGIACSVAACDADRARRLGDAGGLRHRDGARRAASRPRAGRGRGAGLGAARGARGARGAQDRVARHHTQDRGRRRGRAPDGAAQHGVHYQRPRGCAVRSDGHRRIGRRVRRTAARRGRPAGPGRSARSEEHAGRIEGAAGAAGLSPRPRQSTWTAWQTPSYTCWS